MPDGQPSESPLDTVVATGDEQTAEAFKLLGNDTRLAILLALWEAKDPGGPPSEWSEPALGFSELYDRIDIRDSGNFNYHLEKLTGTFVQETEEGYKLTWSAEQVLTAVFAGILTGHSSFEGEPVDAECYRCGAPVVIDYTSGSLIKRCTSCDGAAQLSDYPSGLLAGRYQPPVGLANRTPQEFHRAGLTWNRHRVQSLMEGVCPDCTGTVTATSYVCEDHETGDGTVCERCGTAFETIAQFVCDVCKNSWTTPGYAPIMTEEAVNGFFHEHGLDPGVIWNDPSKWALQKAIERVEVRAEEPPEVEVAIELDGDHLYVTLDDEAQVVNVTEETRKTD